LTGEKAATGFWRGADWTLKPSSYIRPAEAASSAQP
jgi:hypothetical protein